MIETWLQWKGVLKGTQSDGARLQSCRRGCTVRSLTGPLVGVRDDSFREGNLK